MDTRDFFVSPPRRVQPAGNKTGLYRDLSSLPAFNELYFSEKTLGKIMDTREYFIFEIGTDRFALPMSQVERAVSCDEMVLDHSASGEAYVSLCHNQVPIVSGHARFEVEPSGHAKSLLILRSENGLVGLQVEQFCGVHGFKECELLAPSAIFERNPDAAIAGFFRYKTHDDLVVVLDSSKLLSSSEEILQAA